MWDLLTHLLTALVSGTSVAAILRAYWSNRQVVKRDEVTALFAIVDRLERRELELAADLGRARAELNDLRTQHTTAIMELEHLTGENRRLSAENQVIRARVKALEGELDALRHPGGGSGP